MADRHTNQDSKPKVKKASSKRGRSVRKPSGAYFQVTFLSVVALTVLSLVVSVYVACGGFVLEEPKRLLETCMTTWKLGFGAILGLLGGRMLA